MNKQKLDRFETIIDEHQQGLFRFAFFRTGSTDDSQDIVQSVLMRFYDRTKDFAAIENIKNYLYRSVSNACSDYHRRRQSQKTVPLAHAAHKTAETSQNDEAAKEFERIAALLARLPEEQAEVIRMRTVDDLSFVEIADILQIAPTTAKSRFKYGIDKLRSKIEKH